MNKFFAGNTGQKICTTYDNFCVDRGDQYFLNQNNAALVACNCLPDCNKIKYEYFYYFDKILAENETSQNQAIATIHFGDDEFLAYKRYETYGRVGLLSNIGGLLGLFLGISFLSIIETIYFFTLRFFDDLWHD